MNDVKRPIVIRTDSHRPPPVELAIACRMIAAERDSLFWRTLAKAVEHAQVFEFGHIHDAKLRVESKRGGELWTKQLLRMPFRSCIYWYQHEIDQGFVLDNMETFGSLVDRTDFKPQRYCTIAAEVTEELPVGWAAPAIMAVDFIESPSERGDQKAAFTMGGAAIFGVSTEEPDHWRGHLIDSIADSILSGGGGQVIATGDMQLLKGHETGALIGSIVDGVVGLSMVLATKGIPLRREEYSSKLNAKRVRNGKAPLVPITYVDTRRYFEALRNTETKGHHASPVPHLRRGHIRHYQSGKQLWIKDMLVNCRSLEEVSTRDHYEVTDGSC